MELCRKQSLTLAQGLIILGYGYIAVSRCNQGFAQLPRRLQTCLLAWTGPGGVAFTSFSDFFSRSKLDVINPIEDGELDSLLQGIRDSMLQRLEDLRPKMKMVLDIITVDRTRAHYGTIAPQEGFIPTFEIPGPLRADEVRWIRTLMEYCYRDHYLDVGERYRKLIADVELISINSSKELLEEVLVSIQNLEEDIGAIQVQAREVRIEPISPMKALWKLYRPSSWARRWRTQNSLRT